MTASKNTEFSEFDFIMRNTYQPKKKSRALLAALASAAVLDFGRK